MYVSKSKLHQPGKQLTNMHCPADLLQILCRFSTGSLSRLGRSSVMNRQVEGQGDSDSAPGCSGSVQSPWWVDGVLWKGNGLFVHLAASLQLWKSV
jgi:hypothetical protein